MKYRPSRTQITWGVTAFLTLVACVIFIYLVYNGRTFLQAFQTIMNSLQPILYGIVIAFILNPVMAFVEKRMLAPVYQHYGVDVWSAQGRRKRMQMRKISVSITIAFFIALLAAMLAIVLPQLTRSIQTIFSNLTVYERNVLGFFDQVSRVNPEVGAQINRVIINTENFLENFYQENIAANLTDILQRAASQAYTIGRGMFNFIIGIIVSIYLMYTKDTLSGQGKKVAYALFDEKWGNEVVGACRYINRTFVGFLTGKILDSFIIGILCFFATEFITHTPFPVLASFIVGFTNVIPFFGPFIGAVVGGVIVFMINPLDALWFVLLCLVLQTFDGYILGPKILGDSTGLSNFWVIFAIMLFGGLWGVAGWVIGVPLFAVFYRAMARLVNHFLHKKGKTTSSEHMQTVAYYEDGAERTIGDMTATDFHANQKESSSWVRALGIDVSRLAGRAEEKKAQKAKEEEQKEQKEQKNQDHT